MEERYARWVFENVTDALGNCAKYTKAMREVFPELTIKAGYYHCIVWGPRQHWWLESPGGRIVDPTASQFPTKGTGEYEPLEPDDRPIGKCMNCGSDVFPGAPDRSICSVECEEDFSASIRH